MSGAPTDLRLPVAKSSSEPSLTDSCTKRLYTYLYDGSLKSLVNSSTSFSAF